MGNAVGRGDGSAAVQALRVAAALTVPLATLVSLVAWRIVGKNGELGGSAVNEQV